MAPVFSCVPTSASVATASDDEEGTFGDREDERSEIERVEMDLPPLRARTMSVTEGVSRASAGRIAAGNRRRVGNVSSPRPRAETIALRKPMSVGGVLFVSRPLLHRRQLLRHRRVRPRPPLGLGHGRLTERGNQE